jgi:serine/threonine protein kinase/tetratricopeptide (TPR) repeat protein
MSVPLLPASPPLLPGTRLGAALVVERHVGTGGMGAVYGAYDELLDRKVAVKVLRGADQDKVALRTLLEARAAARVVHPCVVAVHAIGDHDGQPYIEMEWVEGWPLRALIATRTLPDLRERGLWIAQLAAALQHAHEAGVVHCDVKPENVLVREILGLPRAVKLADFGLARSTRDATDVSPLSQGTLLYLAPETSQGPPTAQSDQFSFAMLCAELLAERPLRPDFRVMPVLRPTPVLPMAAWQALERGLQIEPHARFATIAAFADALLRGLGLQHLRGPLVGFGPPQALESGSFASSELPVPAVTAPLLGVEPETLLLAVLAVLPQGYPGALREVFGGELPMDVVQRLIAKGQIEGGNEDWRLRLPTERDDLLRVLAPRHARILCARAALAVETVGPKRESVREDATRLYLAARRLPDAARLALESAEAARSARERDHHYARAASLLCSPVQPVPWLAALLQRCEWALQCGWLHLARGPLVEAQGVVVDAKLDADHPLRLRTTLATAQLRALQGEPLSSLAQLQLLVAGVCADPGRDPLALLAHARLCDTFVRLRRRKDALAHGQKVLDGLPDDAPALHLDTGQRALGSLHLHCGTAALREGRQLDALSLYQRALAIQQERGDHLHAAASLVALGNYHASAGDFAPAERKYTQAAALVAPLGGIELAGVVDANLGDCWLRMGRPWPALRSLYRAQVLFEEIGATLHEPPLLRSLADACTALGDHDGARQARERATWLESRRTGQRTSDRIKP